MPRQLRIEVAASGARLDRALADSAAQLSRRAVRRLIERGQVFVDGRRCAIASRTLQAGARIVVHLEEGPSLEASLPILHQTDELVVIDKPPGIAVNKTETQSARSVEEVLGAQLGTMFVVHRLDRDTSGVMVLARSKTTAVELSEAFRARTVEKAYLAICQGVPAEGWVEAPIGKDRRRPRARAVRALQQGGQAAQTEIRLLGTAQTLTSAQLSAVEALPKTGRTHQIRVHLASLGTPIFGDTLYGGSTAVSVSRNGAAVVLQATRVMLHARRLAFPHGGEMLRFDAPLPEDIQALGAVGLPLKASFENSGAGA